MSDFDPKAFTFDLDALGLKLTATRMVDGTIRINQWRMHEYWSNEKRAKELWERTIAGSDSNRKILAEFLVSLDRGGAPAQPACAGAFRGLAIFPFPFRRDGDRFDI